MRISSFNQQVFVLTGRMISSYFFLNFKSKNFLYKFAVLYKLLVHILVK